MLRAEVFEWIAFGAVLTGIFIAVSPGISAAPHAQTSGSSPASLKIIERLSRPPNVTGLAWSPDGSKLATFSNYTSAVTIWDASDWRIIRTFPRYSAGYVGNAFAWMPNGLILAPNADDKPGENNRSLSLWDAETGTLAKNIPGPKPEIFAVSQDGSAVAIANSSYQVFLFNTQTWSISATLRLDHIPEAVAFGPGRLAVGGTEGKLVVFNLARLEIERTLSAFPSNRSVASTAFSPSGKFLAAVPTFGYGGVTALPLDGGPIRVWNTNTGERAATLGPVEGNSTLPQVAWSADGTLLAAISYSGLLEVWRIGPVSASVFEERFPTHGSAVTFSPNGTLAAAVGAEVVILK